jgi:hypothetical protein
MRDGRDRPDRTGETGRDMALYQTIGQWLYVLRKTFLTRASRRHYSQFGEDVLLDQIIDPRCRPGNYVDVGAYHPTKFSNTYFLYRRGWRGVNIDLDPVKIDAFRLARPRDVNICAAVSDQRRVATSYAARRFDLGATIDPDTADRQTGPLEARAVETRTLNEILAATSYAGTPIDLLCIDAEGHDWPVLRAFDLAVYRPSIVVIESHLETIERIMNDEAYRHLAAHGYRLCGWTYLSLIFRRPEGAIFRAPTGAIGRG